MDNLYIDRIFDSCCCLHLGDSAIKRLFLTAISYVRPYNDGKLTDVRPYNLHDVCGRSSV